MQNRDEQIRQRAYDLWQQAGEPHGRDREFWDLAAREIEADASGDDPQPIDAVTEPDNRERTRRADIDRLTPTEATAATMPGGPGRRGSRPEAETRRPL